jgi:hypothetical protein
VHEDVHRKCWWHLAAPEQEPRKHGCPVMPLHLRSRLLRCKVICNISLIHFSILAIKWKQYPEGPQREYVSTTAAALQ